MAPSAAGILSDEQIGIGAGIDLYGKGKRRRLDIPFVTAGYDCCYCVILDIFIEKGKHCYEDPL